MDSKSKELETKKDNTLAVNRRVTGDRPAGLDEVDLKNDLKLPRLSVLQSMSRMVQDDKGKVGDFAHSVTKENFGKELEFIPLFMFKSRAQFEVGKGLVMLSRDNQKVTFGVDEFEKYIGKDVDEVPHPKDPQISAIDWAGNNPPSFSLVYNFMILLTGERLKDFPMVASFMKTASTTAKDFLSQIAYSQEDAFSRIYKLKTRMEDNDKGRFAVPVIEFSRRCDDAEYEFARKRFQELYVQRSKIDVDLEEAHTEQ